MKKNKKNYNINISHLTDEEINVINIIKNGEPIVGKKETEKAIINWINMCLSNRIISN
jgi:hypothetical protein